MTWRECTREKSGAIVHVQTRPTIGQTNPWAITSRQSNRVKGVTDISILRGLPAVPAFDPQVQDHGSWPQAERRQKSGTNSFRRL